MSRHLMRLLTLPVVLLLAGRDAFPQKAFREAISAASPAVVKISAGTRLTFLGRRAALLASGVILTSDGYLVTCASSLARRRTVTAGLPDGSRATAKVVKRDTVSDLAILKVNRTGLPTVRLNTDGPPRVGQWVAAVANPFGLARTRTDSLSASIGVVSAVRRITVDDFAYTGPVILTDIIVNPGASGGALVDLGGRLVGVCARIRTSTRTHSQLSFAVPVSVVQELLVQAREDAGPAAGEERPPQTPDQSGYLGAYILDEAEGTKGAYIQKVVPGSPGALVGLVEGDLITAMNGTPIPSGRRLIEQLDRCKVGQRLNLTVLRQKAVLKITVTLGKAVRPVLR